ncbi:hypothetical protein Misp06_02892 [Microbulbifer sp. NBRC 101763]|uniref:thioesterase family protein n=1 Tax=Microbulbifer sp. NBRC 101763 TaxID=1113820 RepID=UPI0030B405AB
MNLYLRLIVAFVRGFFLPKIDASSKLVRIMRVLPNDIDINGHLNNGRYSTLVDLLIVEAGLRAGILKKAVKLGWKPVAAGSLISYRKQLSPFEKYNIHFEMDCWDDKWSYMKFKFEKKDGSIAAIGYTKCGFLSRRGLVEQKIADEKLGMHREEMPLTLAIENWIKAEQALVSEI